MGGRAFIYWRYSAGNVNNHSLLSENTGSPKTHENFNSETDLQIICLGFNQLQLPNGWIVLHQDSSDWLGLFLSHWKVQYMLHYLVGTFFEPGLMRIKHRCNLITKHILFSECQWFTLTQLHNTLWIVTYAWGSSACLGRGSNEQTWLACME